MPRALVAHLERARWRTSCVVQIRCLRSLSWLIDLRHPQFRTGRSLVDQHSYHEIDVERRRRAGSLGWLARRLGPSGLGLGAGCRGCRRDRRRRRCEQRPLWWISVFRGRLRLRPPRPPMGTADILRRTMPIHIDAITAGDATADLFDRLHPGSRRLGHSREWAQLPGVAADHVGYINTRSAPAP